MKEVVVRQYFRQDGRASASRSPELVIGGNPVELPGVRRIAYDSGSVTDFPTVTVTFIARLETIVQREACGCGHQPHPGLVCGWPVQTVTGTTQCECEG